MPRAYEVEISKEGTRARVDGKDPRGLDEYFKTIKAVAFVPGDLRMVDGSPERRRTFLDRAAFTLDPTFLGIAQDYKKALAQKNALLREGKQGRSVDRELLRTWNASFCNAATEVILRRVDFLERFAPVFREVHEGITGAAKGRAEIRYRASVGADSVRAGRAAVATALREKAAKSEAQELLRGHSLMGPHRDDWELRVGDEVLRTFGSQGQVRSAALALRVAQMVLAKRQLGTCPLFLLDDVSSELDADRNRQMMAVLDSLEAQVLITTTERANLQMSPASYRSIALENGAVCG